MYLVRFFNVSILVFVCLYCKQQHTVSVLLHCCHRDPVKRFHHTMMTKGTPTDRPKSIHIRCVIEGFVGDFNLFCFYFHFLMVWGFCHIDWSDLFPFLMLIFTLVNQCEFENNMHSMLIITFMISLKLKTLYAVHISYYIWEFISASLKA